MNPLLPDGPITPGVHAAATVLRPVMNAAVSKQWHGLDRLPSGGCIAVANHVSELDPVAVAHAIYSSGRTPHFLAKDSLFRLPVVGQALTRLKQIPVARGDRQRAQASLEVAREVLAEGGCIVVYPEGTLTRDPDLWPMRMKTGAARLALSTSSPVVPVTHWGVQQVLPPYAKVPRPVPRKRYRLQVGDPVDLEDLRSRPMTRTVLAEATERIETALTQGVAQLRGETPPEGIWDRALNQRVPRGQLRAAAEQQNRNRQPLDPHEKTTPSDDTSGDERPEETA
ncbi:lysophospholipid acyltransferase family protein [Nesterenkonia alba]|uniref:lysophospholipid acyltransferase family protein n=1 Tax=Nesterenkonia alba TaxID=515814 RepID=UPI0003B6C529|nr:lysophospholipid acyltransferase family protein [Nesterenkonia alba]